jgi:predicted transcriptional regulator
MEVRFTPEQEAQLSRIATHDGMDTEHFVKEAALRLVETRNRFSAAVSEGIVQADQGAY